MKGLVEFINEALNNDDQIFRRRFHATGEDTLVKMKHLMPYFIDNSFIKNDALKEFFKFTGDLDTGYGTFGSRTKSPDAVLDIIVNIVDVIYGNDGKGIIPIDPNEFARHRNVDKYVEDKLKDSFGWCIEIAQKGKDTVYVAVRKDTNTIKIVKYSGNRDFKQLNDEGKFEHINTTKTKIRQQIANDNGLDIDKYSDIIKNALNDIIDEY